MGNFPNSYINKAFKGRNKEDLSFLLEDIGVSFGMLLLTQLEHPSILNV